MAIDQRQHLSALTRGDIGIGAVLGVGALALYGRTLAPSLLWGDSAEFQTLGATLGMAHSTGYAVYLLIGNLFTHLPIGSVAYRMNLVSACAAAVTLVLLYLSSRTLGCHRSAAFLGACALGVTPLFWWHAVIAEIYTMGAACIATIIFLLLRWRHTTNWRYLFAAGVTGGLSLGIHTTVALLAPTVLLYMLLSTRRLAPWAGAAAGAIAGVALTAGAFTLIDTIDAPASFYNSTVRPWLSRWDLYPYGFSTPTERIFFVLSARQFDWAMQRVPVAELVQRAGGYIQALRAGWALAALGLMALGLVATLVRRTSARAGWREGSLLLLAWLTLVLFVLNYSVFDVYVFYIPTFVPLALFASLGASALLDGVTWLVRCFNVRNATPLTAILGTALLVAAVWPARDALQRSVATGQITFLDNTDLVEFPYPVHTPNRPHNQAVQLIEHVENDAIIFTNWGTVFTLYYVAHVEQGRTGIMAHEWFSQNDDPQANVSVIRYIDSNLGRHPIYFTYIPDSIRARYTFVQVAPDTQLFRIAGRVTATQ